MIYRPDLVHTLGGWMVRRITNEGTNPEKAVEVLINPTSLYTLYNQTLEKGMEDIAVDTSVVVKK